MKPLKLPYLKMLRTELRKLLIFLPRNRHSKINYFFTIKDFLLRIPDIPEGPLLIFRNILIDNNFTTSQVALKVLNYRTLITKVNTKLHRLAAEKLQSFTPIPVGSIISSSVFE